MTTPFSDVSLVQLLHTYCLPHHLDFSNAMSQYQIVYMCVLLQAISLLKVETIPNKFMSIVIEN